MGIDVNRFTGDNHEQFQCAVCLDIVEEPVETPCEHLFCKSCLKTTDAGATKYKCPTCRKEFNHAKSVNRNLKAIYDSLKLRCTSSECKEQFTISNYKSHDETCQKRFFKCSSCITNQPLDTMNKSHCEPCIKDLTKRVRQLEKYNQDFRNKNTFLQMSAEQLQPKVTELQSKINHMQLKRRPAVEQQSIYKPSVSSVVPVVKPVVPSIGN